MCGLAGIIEKNATQLSANRLQVLSDTLQHRGPDGAGTWIDADGHCGLAHRRLAILDKSPAAAQPLHYLHYTVMLNGEIYNYLELKNFLQKKGYIFNTEGDTEIIPAAFDHWGIHCLERFDGMFVFTLVNEKTKTLYIVRDRFGEKPLYYTYTGPATNFTSFLFASEMKALWADGISRQLAGTPLLQYLALGEVSHFPDKSQTFYEHIYNLPQGHYLCIDISKYQFAKEQWYHPTFEKKTAACEEDTCIQQFSSLFETSVGRRLRSHVHTGSSLSGGIDSASIVATIHQLANKSSQWKNIAFTAAFPGFQKDESERSKAIAAYLDMQQELIYPSVKDWIDEFEKMMYHQEEPLQSSSVLTQFLVYKKAREKNIIVLLDGQGADELLGGYKKYTRWYLQFLWRKNKPLFKAEKEALARNHFLDDWNFRDRLAAISPAKASKALRFTALQKIRQTPFIHPDFYRAHRQPINIQKPVINCLEDILYFNSFQSGLDELLRYADRNAMAHSVEVRLPFLYHELAEFIFSLPASMKIHAGFTKWILRKATENKLPGNIVWAKGKTGFEPPQENWMKQTPIVELIRQSRARLVTHGLLRKEIIEAPIIAREAHAADNYDWRFLCVAALLK